jgi:hypothetical protein
MVCPKCGGSVTVSYPRDFGFVHCCNCCAKEWNSRKAIDPIELLRLIKKVEKARFRILADIIYRNGSERAKGHETGILKGLEVIKSALTGDPSALKKLAGE